MMTGLRLQFMQFMQNIAGKAGYGRRTDRTCDQGQ